MNCFLYNFLNVLNTEGLTEKNENIIKVLKDKLEHIDNKTIKKLKRRVNTYIVFKQTGLGEYDLEDFIRNNYDYILLLDYDNKIKNFIDNFQKMDKEQLSDCYNYLLLFEKHKLFQKFTKIFDSIFDYEETQDKSCLKKSFDIFNIIKDILHNGK